MLDKILVPLDGSELSERVLPVAEELASKLSAEIVLLQGVISSTQAMREALPGAATIPEVAMDVAKQRVESETHAAEKYLGELSQRLQGKGLRVSTAVIEGPASAAILDYATANGASLIALATHGRSGLARTVLGSVADEVVRSSVLPVLLVRAKD